MHNIFHLQSSPLIYYETFISNFFTSAAYSAWEFFPPRKYKGLLAYMESSLVDVIEWKTLVETKHYRKFQSKLDQIVNSSGAIMPLVNVTPHLKLICMAKALSDYERQSPPSLP